MKKKLLAMTLASAMLASALAGCGGSSAPLLWRSSPADSSWGDWCSVTSAARGSLSKVACPSSQRSSCRATPLFSTAAAAERRSPLPAHTAAKYSTAAAATEAAPCRR